MKLKRGDKVKILSGKDKGRTGKIDKVYPHQNKVLIAGINIYKKHIKKSEKVPQGGVVDLPRPIYASKVGIICPKCGKVARIGFESSGNKKFRKCKICKEKI